MKVLEYRAMQNQKCDTDIKLSTRKVRRTFQKYFVHLSRSSTLLLHFIICFIVVTFFFYYVIISPVFVTICLYQHPNSCNTIYLTQGTHTHTYKILMYFYNALHQYLFVTMYMSLECFKSPALSYSLFITRVNTSLNNLHHNIKSKYIFIFFYCLLALCCCCCNCCGGKLATLVSYTNQIGLTLETSSSY